jgi:hypothetical protein
MFKYLCFSKSEHIFGSHSWLKDTVALTDIPVGGYGFFVGLFKYKKGKSYQNIKAK